ncbi:hypothetical protein JW921_07240, partial [Candidatus Fermentibacterales bacterium]|nr:hypothetical protein [Candidatus Fermentibacterales bacterium]
GSGWNGRIYGLEGRFTGVAAGSVVLRDRAGSVDTVLASADGSLIADINGDNGVDVVEASPGLVRVISNVVGSSGMTLTVRAVTGGREVMVEDIYTIGSIPGRCAGSAGAVPPASAGLDGI